MEDEILQKYQVRKSNKQKTEFMDYLKHRLAESGYDPEKDIVVETRWKGILKTSNIIVGNPEEAEVFMTAHYDTCAVIPFPNLMAPTNYFLFWTYQIILAVIIILFAGLIAFPIGLLTQSFWLSYNAFLWALIGLIFHLMFGFRNKHTANDNTSGVIAVTRILENLPQEHRKKVCVVYFDNEEKGLFGSMFFASKHKKTAKDKLLINLDCVGDGKHVVTMAKGAARKDKNYSLLCDEFTRNAVGSEVVYLCKKMKPMMFPSDQTNFNKGIGVCALKKSPIGMYVARIHTPFDTRCREENIDFLTRALVGFAEKIQIENNNGAE